MTLIFTANNCNINIFKSVIDGNSKIGTNVSNEKQIMD